MKLISFGLIIALFSVVTLAQGAPETDESDIQDGQTSKQPSPNAQNDEVPIDDSGTPPAVTAKPESMREPYDGSGAIIEKAEKKIKMGKFCNCIYRPDTPYRSRRGVLGGFVGVQGGTYAPTNYQPDTSTEDFNAVYGSSGTPIEVAGGVKLNSILGSLGVNITGGIYNASKGTRTLKLTPITVGAIAALDTIFPEPYVVPYGIVGAYSVIYQETSGGISVKGNSEPALFYAAGVMLQLDWLDLESHDAAYMDYGLENIYLYVEGRSFLASTKTVPNFSTPIHFDAGIKFEF